MKKIFTLGGILAFFSHVIIAQSNLGEIVPFVTTSDEVMMAMFDLANIRPDDVLLDLGSGDGRIPIAAAQKFGINSLGVEIDPGLVALSDSLAVVAGVDHLVTFVQGDLFEFDFNQASVLIIYLFPDINEKLLPKILAMPKGARVISHQYPIGKWKPLQTKEVKTSEDKIHRLFYWEVP